MHWLSTEYMRRFIGTSLLILAVAWPSVLYAQAPPGLEPVDGIARNEVTVLHAQGDSLWAGPALNMTPDGGQHWFAASAGILDKTPNRVQSIDVEGQIVWTGLGHRRTLAGTSVPVAGGFLVSTDGGHSFAFRPPPLDAPVRTSRWDTVRYGSSLLLAQPVLTPQQSLPYALDYQLSTGTVWVASGQGGLRRSSDRGETWSRVVLPPDSLTAIHPDSSYSFVLRPRSGSSGHANHVAYSVLVDEAGTLWVGTQAGLNRSRPRDDHPVGRAWQRISLPDSARTASWVTDIEEQPVPGRNPVWAAVARAPRAASGQPGLLVTRDGGATFEAVLSGERINDLAFRSETTIYAASSKGLFISTDDGRTWRTEQTFGTGLPVRPVYAVATTSKAVWVGTTEGLFRSTDGGQSWTAFRADVPLSPSHPTPEQPRVSTYAYPNPFSPATDHRVRIRYRLSDGQAAAIRLFDFSMNLVRSFRDRCAGTGLRTCEAFWDGTDRHGLRVASGVYFYAVDTGDEKARGKILVVE